MKAAFKFSNAAFVVFSPLGSTLTTAEWKKIRAYAREKADCLANKHWLIFAHRSRATSNSYGVETPPTESVTTTKPQRMAVHPGQVPAREEGLR